MTATKRTVTVAIALLFSMLSIAGMARAQTYPDRQVTIVVPFAPGGATDTTARILANELSKSLDETVIVENRPGAGAVVGAASVATSQADGYTLLFSTITTHGTGPALRDVEQYDHLADFAPISKVGVMPSVLLAGKDVPVDTVAKLIALAKENPGALNYASPGVGSSLHFAAELFKIVTGAEIQHIPYGGSALALTDLIAGNVELAFDTVPASIGHIRAAAIKPLAVTTAQRAGDLPDVPTMMEAGLEDFDVSSWSGLWAPAGTPPEIIARLNEDVVAALNNENVQEQLRQVGIAAEPTTPEEFEAFVREETERWAQVVEEANIEVE